MSESQPTGARVQDENLIEYDRALSSQGKGSAALSDAIPEALIRTCPDCGFSSSGKFCSQCGEEMEPALPPLSHYLKELFNEFLAFDSKLVRTIPALLFKPGFLTNEYVAGRRRRYLLPWRLYALVAFLAFFILSSYIHLELGDWIAAKSINVKLNGLSPKDGQSVVETLSRLWNSIFPYVLLVECSPIFALYLKLLYRKSGKLYVEHLIFTFHVFAFSLFVFLPAFLIKIPWTEPVGLVLFLIYLGVALHRVYGVKRWRLVWHLALSAVMFALVLIQAAVLALILTVAFGAMFDLFPLSALTPKKS